MEDSDEGLRFLTHTDENLLRRDSMGKCGGFDPYIFESQASAHDADTLKLLADKLRAFQNHLKAQGSRLSRCCRSCGKACSPVLLQISDSCEILCVDPSDR